MLTYFYRSRRSPGDPGSGGDVCGQSEHRTRARCGSRFRPGHRDRNAVPCGRGGSWDLLASSAVAFQFVKYLGAAYMIYLGIKTLRRNDEQLAEADTGETKLIRLFGQGLLVNLLNPKTALFFLAFLPQFVDPGRGHVTLQILQLGVLFALMGWCSDSVYSVIAGTVAERIRSSLRLRRAQRNVSGGALIAPGLASAFSGSQSKYIAAKTQYKLVWLEQFMARGYCGRE